MLKEGILVAFETSVNGAILKESDMVVLVLVLDVDARDQVPSSNGHDPSLKEIQFRLGNAGRPKSGSGTENMKRPKLVRGSVPNIKPMEFGFVINGVEVGLKRRTDGVEVLEQNKIKIDSLVSFFQAQPLSLPSLPSHSFHHCQSSLFSEFSRYTCFRLSLFSF